MSDDNMSSDLPTKIGEPPEIDECHRNGDRREHHQGYEDADVGDR